MLLMSLFDHLLLLLVMMNHMRMLIVTVTTNPDTAQRRTTTATDTRRRGHDIKRGHGSVPRRVETATATCISTGNSRSRVTRKIPTTTTTGRVIPTAITIINTTIPITITGISTSCPGCH
jgi:hypothetical protein